MKKHLSLIFWFTLFILTGCNPFGKNSLIQSLVNQTSISGKVVPYVTGMSVASSCDKEVKIYRLDSVGQITGDALASGIINSDGSYQLNLENVDLNPNNVNYIVQAIGCTEAEKFSRPITGYANQDVSIATTLLETVADSSSNTKLSDLSYSNVEKALSILKNYDSENTIEDVYNTLNSQPANKAEFETVTGIQLVDLSYEKPKVKLTTIPLTPLEASDNIYSVTASHWHSAYQITYQWKLDGVVVSAGTNVKNFTYVPGKDAQGVHTLQLRVGYANLDGSLNVSAQYPYVTQIFKLNTQNNVLPTVPVVTHVVGGVIEGNNKFTNSQSASVQIQTGVAMVNCETFSSYGWSENSLLAPVLSNFTGACIQEPTQNSTYWLSSGDGLKTLRLWAKDSSDTVSLLSQTIHFTLDQTAPSLSTASLSGTLAGGSSQTIAYTVNDLTSGIDKIEFYYAADGATFVKLENDIKATNPYTWSVPVENRTAAKIKLIAYDKAGNSTEASSSGFDIDSTKPAALALTRTSNAITNSQNVEMTVTGCSGDAVKMIFLESASAPVVSDAGWENCSSAKTFQVTSGDGVKNIYAFAKDLAGNISLVSNQIQITLDQVVPGSPNIVLTQAATNNPLISMTMNNCSGGISHVYVSENATAPTSSTSNWQACVTSAGAITYTLANSTNEVKTLYAWSKDTASNVSTASTQMAVTFDTVDPVLTSVIVNDGAQYTGTPFVSVKVQASDNLTAIQLHLIEVDNTVNCTTNYNANSNWVSYTSSSTALSFAINNLDGIKKICAWARDVAGNEIDLTEFKSDSIEFQVSSPPEITGFSALNPFDSTTNYSIGHQNVDINWSVNSTLGFATNPISLSYTTDGTNYLDVVTNQNISTLSNITWVGGNATSGTYTAWSAPIGFFRLRISVRDMAGNIGTPAYSDVQNGGQWSIYAGTTDRGVGGAGKAAVLAAQQAGSQIFTVNPLNNDIYALDESRGIRKLDAVTGVVSTFIADGTNNLMTGASSANGWKYLPDSPRVSPTRLIFDANGFLYLFVGNGGDASANTSVVYQINPATNEVRIYLNGGTSVGSGASPPPLATAYVQTGALAFDEENSLYFMVNCVPGSVIYGGGSYHQKYQIAKATQDPVSKTATSIEVIAGNCASAATPANGSIAKDNPLPTLGYPTISGLEVWEKGKYLYYGSGSGGFKIIDGLYYASSVGAARGLKYQPSTGKLYRNLDGAVETWTPNLAGAGGDIKDATNYVSASGTGNCTADDILASDACVTSSHGFSMNAQGRIFFTDGSPQNAGSTFRVRYVNDENKVKTIIGTLPVYAKDLNNQPLDAILARGVFSGIFYKKSTLGTADNLAAYPEGLYFVEKTGPVFGYIHPVTKKVSILWGNQNQGTIISSGTVVSPDNSMGKSYAYRIGQLMTFDSTGVPWMAASSYIYSLDTLKRLNLKTSTTSNFEFIANGSSASSLYTYVNGYSNNLEVADNGLSFIMGAYVNSTYPAGSGVLKAINYSASDVGDVLAGKVYGVMGDASVSATTSPLDSVSSPAALTTRILSPACSGTGCKTRYVQAQNRLYFQEYQKLRYIDNPQNITTAPLATLSTLFTAGSNLNNFILNHDNSTVYYIRNDGKLYCYNITSVRADCGSNGTEAANLGPVAGAPAIGAGANQMTWKDNTTLLISTYTGYIYEYRVP